MKHILIIPLALMLGGMLCLSSCQKGNLIDNPNVASGNSLIPVSLLAATQA